MAGRLVDVFLDPHEGRPLAEQLYQQLRRGIADGRLRAGDRLVPSRQLAGELGVSRQTVTTAYSRLVAEGYAEGHAGGGSVVAPAPAPQKTASRSAALQPARRFADWTPLFPSRAPSHRFDLRPGQPDQGLFPVTLWRRRVAAAITADRADYADPRGEIRLRQAIARWVTRSRSVVADEETVLITAGAQHAASLAAQVLLEPGDTVAVEEPGYWPMRRLFTALGANVVGLLPPAARIVYVTPSHQFPLGMTMSMLRRCALLRWAQKNNAAIIEDDYDTNFRYVDRPIEPLQALDHNGRVIYLGSFSKTLSPTVRLGFAVVPPPLAEPVAALRQLIDWHPPTAMQAAMAGIIEDGLLDKHLRGARRVYAERHRILAQALSEPLANFLTARIPGAGLHIAAFLRDGLDEDAVIQAAARCGILLMGLRNCYHASPFRRGLLLGFSAIRTTDLPPALDTLASMLARQSPRVPAR
jgi:GntR family transcriptional regulator / MocR family aminotransferase